MKRFFLYAGVICLLLGGCAQSDDSVTPTQPSLPTQVIQASPSLTGAVIAAPTLEMITPTEMSQVELGPCSNAYFPVVDGATWVYDIDGVSQAVHTLSVDDEDSFHIAIVSGDSTAVLEGRCSQEGIILLEAGMEGNYFTDSGTSSTNTDYQEGVTLPNNLKVGDAWTQVTGLTGDSGEISLEARVITNYNVIGKETITVPAGTFETLKIEQRASMVIQGKEILTDGLLWYALGVGNVQTETGLGGGEKFLVRLISYDIP